jgi:hypothetical protein
VGQFVEGLHDTTKVLDPVAIEQAESYEGAYIADCLWVGPGEDTSDFGRVHLELIAFYHYS